MATVNSVLGPLDTAQLGFTLPHEHIHVSTPGLHHVYPELMRHDYMETAVRDMTQAHQEGVDTIIDISPFDLGRDVKFLEEVSRRSGMNIICATGNHVNVPREYMTMSLDAIADLWVREIEVGIQDTGIRAGIIKVATSDPITEAEEICLRVTARAHKRTGVPISTHTPHLSRIGEEQLRILAQEGVDLGRVYVGHVNSTPDMDYYRILLRRGAWLGMDHYFPAGPPNTPSWEERTDLIKKLIDAGYGHRVMVSHDWNGGRSSSPWWYSQPAQNPDGYLLITRKVLPRLRMLGVPEDTVRQLMVDNPRRFFEGV